MAKPTRGLTVKGIEALRPRPERYDVRDSGSHAGLVLRVGPTGSKTFRWRVHAAAGHRSILIGPWAAEPTARHVTLAEARAWLDRLKQAHRAGTLDAVASELAITLVSAPAPVPDRTLFRNVAEEWYRDDIVINRVHPRYVRYMLDRDLLPAFGDRPIASITTVDCGDVVRRIVTGTGRAPAPSKRRTQPSPVQAGKVLAVMKQLFDYAQVMGHATSNPAGPLRDRHVGVVTRKRQRCLNPDEITAFWKALDSVGRHEVGAIALKLLLLLGVRTGELRKAEWCEVDWKAATWTIPVSHRKMKKKAAQTARPLAVPLPPTAVELLRELKEKGGTFVLPSDQAHGGSLNQSSIPNMMRRLCDVHRFEGERPTPHTLRRTMRTGLGKLRVPRHIAEACLGHSLGTIVDTYDVGDYLDERREALEKWDAYVSRVVSGVGADVVAFPVAG